ncbi:MAG: hypothetical protein KF799_04350 [Bdellovibrionales bacterium]|nr:hypothetical protein [Bdellovibrionales bacterium]
MSIFAAIFSLWYLTAHVSALPIICSSKVSQFEAPEDLVHKIAIIGKDDRKGRNSDASNLEKAQGRAYCVKKPFPKGIVPTLAQIDSVGAVVSNAVVAFEDDMIIVNRHKFIKPDGGSKAKLQNCYFEHIASGEIIPLVDAEYTKQLPGKANSEHQDYAIVRLKTKPKGAHAIPEDMIIVDNEDDLSKPVTIISNYATNLSNRNSLTMTTCKRYGRYGLTTGTASSIMATDCDTGDGSSGAQAYIEVNGRPKLFGIISGDIKSIPEGGSFDPNKLSTAISTFDNTLFESYQRLKQRQPN